MLIPDYRIVRNSIQCRQCNDTIESRNQHNYVTCSCGAVSVDGGTVYLKRSGERSDIKELSIQERFFRKPFEWSTRDEDIENWMIENGFPLDGNWETEHEVLYKMTWE